MAKINTSLSAVENVLALLNADNSGAVHAFSTANVTLGVPAVRTPDADPRNTTLELTAVQDAGYNGTDTVTYTRLTVLQGVPDGNIPASVTVLPEDDEVAVKAKVVAAYGLLASEVDVANFTAPENENTAGAIDLFAVENSLVYRASQTNVTLVVADSDAPLSDNVTTKQLNGFEPA